MVSCFVRACITKAVILSILICAPVLNWAQATDGEPNQSSKQLYWNTLSNASHETSYEHSYETPYKNSAPQPSLHLRQQFSSYKDNKLINIKQWVKNDSSSFWQITDADNTTLDQPRFVSELRGYHLFIYHRDKTYGTYFVHAHDNYTEGFMAGYMLNFLKKE